MNPRDVYVAGTLVSIVLSLVLFLRGNRSEGIFVGLWAPTVLQLGESLMKRTDD